jgi:hypothetical protein
MDCRKGLSVNVLCIEINFVQKPDIVEIRLVLWEIKHIDFPIFLSILEKQAKCT